MMDYYKPYYAILLILMIFIFLWFFFGQGEYEFIGIKPLNPDYMMDYPDASYLGPLPYPSDAKRKQIEAPRVIELPSLYEEDSVRDICIDLTPTLPNDFITNICLSNNNNKYLSKGEKICRETLEKIYGLPFPNVRPNWLINTKTGHAMELDCYNSDLKISCEYDGISHFKWPNPFHKTYDEFKEQLRRDRLKDKLCKEHGVTLIRVPYNVGPALIPMYIVKQLPEIVQRRIQEDK